MATLWICEYSAMGDDSRGAGLPIPPSRKIASQSVTFTTATPVTSGWTLNVDEYERSLAYEPSNIWHHDGSFGSITRLSKGTYGNLTAGQWGYDSGSTTLAVRLAGDADPATVTVEIPAQSLVTNLSFTTGADGSRVEGVRSFFASQNGFQMTAAPDCVLRNCTSAHNSNDGIGTATDTATGLLIESCIIEGNGDEGRTGAAGDGISFHNATAGTIRNSIIRDNDKAQIDNGQKTTVITERCLIDGVNPWMVFADAGTSGMATARANVVISDGAAHTGAMQSGIAGVLTTIYNNTIFNRSGGSRGIYLANNDGAHPVKNNIVTGFTWGIDYRAATQLDDNYNDLYSNSGADYFDNGTGNFSSHPNDIHEDALFTDSANDDFTIGSGSPCAGAGTDVGVPVDRGGNVYADPPAIGAYEVA